MPCLELERLLALAPERAPGNRYERQLMAWARAGGMRIERKAGT
jgi:hypothetical protein